MGRNRDKRQRRRAERELARTQAELENLRPGARVAPTANVISPQLIGQRLVVQQMQMSTRSVSPLPSPEMLAGYASVDPELVKTIVSMAEREQAHRHASDKRLQDVVENGTKEGFRAAARGQFFAWSIATGFLIGAVVLGLHGQAWLGGVLGTLDLTIIVALFLGQQAQARKESAALQQLEQPQLPGAPAPPAPPSSVQ